MTTYSTERIPFGPGQMSGHEELGGAAPVAINVVSDATGTVRRRPGLELWSEDLPDAIDETGLNGLYETLDGRLFAVATGGTHRRIYKVAEGGATNLAVGSETNLRGSERPTMAETEMLLVFAAGAEIQKLELDSETLSRLGGDPPLASHVVANKLRLLVNDVFLDKTKVNYSDVQIGTTDFSGHETWNTNGTSGFFTAESRPDPVVAIGENTNEVFVWGSGTTQVFAPDAGLVYAPIATREVGCGAPYSIVKADQDFFWLDDKRRFVMSNGRSFDDISGPIARTLDGIEDISDCFGYRVIDGFVDAIVWSFPSDGRTFVFQKGSGWTQWMGRSLGAWQLFPVSAFVASPTHGNLVATTEGLIGRLALGTETDFGEPIDAHVQTGYLDRGTRRLKHCYRARFTLRRGQTTGSSGPQAFFSYRDRPGAWESSIPIDLGVSGDTEVVVEFSALGTYRKRQWRFEFSGTDELTLVHAEEDFEVLEH